MNGIALDIHCEGAQGFHLQVACELPGSGITAIYGPSGSGKTTLLDCIAGLRDTSRPALVRIGDHTWQCDEFALPPWRRELGYVFNDARLFPHLSVAGNLRYAEKRRRGDNAVAFHDVVQWLELEDLLQRMPASLSSGQRQRAAIARALLGAPRMLLLDEPFANLDAQTRTQCLRQLQRLHAHLDIPILLVSHDMEEVSELADHLLLLENGRIRDQGPMIELCSRLDSTLADEERAAAVLRATVRRQDKAYGLTELELEKETLFVSALLRLPGAQQRIRIPARDVSICRERATDSSILNILPVTITEMKADDSARITLRLALGSQYLLARITRLSAEKLNLRVGDKVYAQIKSVALMTTAEQA